MIVSGERLAEGLIDCLSAGRSAISMGGRGYSIQHGSWDWGCRANSKNIVAGIWSGRQFYIAEFKTAYRIAKSSGQPELLGNEKQTLNDLGEKINAIYDRTSEACWKFHDIAYAMQHYKDPVFAQMSTGAEVNWLKELVDLEADCIQLEKETGAAHGELLVYDKKHAISKGFGKSFGRSEEEIKMTKILERMEGITTQLTLSRVAIDGLRSEMPFSSRVKGFIERAVL